MNGIKKVSISRDKPMKSIFFSIAASVMALCGLSLFSNSAMAGDPFHGRYHDDLEHREFHRYLEHRDAHRYPMNRWEHGQLHDQLNYDRFHDRTEHREFHRDYYPRYRSYLPDAGSYYPPYQNYGYGGLDYQPSYGYGYGYSNPGYSFGIQGPRFSLYYGR